MIDDTKRYAQGHLAASHAGWGSFRAAAERYRESPWGTELARLRDDVAEDRHRLEEIATHLGVDVNSGLHRLSQATLSVLGSATRMLHTRGDLGAISEVESLRDAVAAKLAGWEVLLVASAKDHRLSRPDIEGLIARAKDQADRLRTVHLQMAQQVFGHEPVSAPVRRRRHD
jgi:hypothetical protein